MLELPKKWTDCFQSKALAEVMENSENVLGNGSDSPSTGDGTSDDSSSTGGDNNGGENTDPEG